MSNSFTTRPNAFRCCAVRVATKRCCSQGPAFWCTFPLRDGPSLHDTVFLSTTCSQLTRADPMMLLRRSTAKPGAPLLPSSESVQRPTHPQFTKFVTDFAATQQRTFWLALRILVREDGNATYRLDPRSETTDGSTSNDKTRGRVRTLVQDHLYAPQLLQVKLGQTRHGSKRADFRMNSLTLVQAILTAHCRRA